MRRGTTRTLGKKNVRFLRQNFGAIFYTIVFAAGVVVAFATTGWLFWFAVIASLGSGISSFYLWMEPIWRTPWEHTYHTQDWWSNRRQPPEMPQIVVAGSVHKKGRKPKVEFEQADPKYGIGDLRITYVGDEEEDVLITRPNSSIPPFGPVIVRIRK